MSGEVVDIREAESKRTGREPRVSVGLRNVSRETRGEILRSHAYHAFWLGEISKEQYAELLYAHLRLRQALEEQFTSLDGNFCVSNLFTQEEKVFDVEKYVTSKRNKSSLIQQDIEELESLFNVSCNRLPPKADELIEYMRNVKKVYSAALLGILYMLEETVIYAGPRIANALDKRLCLNGKATHYLRSGQNQKADLWEFRKSLDLITDFQTQANIVIASTITYRMYRDLLDPRAAMSAGYSGMFH